VLLLDEHAEVILPPLRDKGAVLDILEARLVSGRDGLARDERLLVNQTADTGHRNKNSRHSNLK